MALYSCRSFDNTANITMNCAGYAMGKGMSIDLVGNSIGDTSGLSDNDLTTLIETKIKNCLAWQYNMPSITSYLSTINESTQWRMVSRIYVGYNGGSREYDYHFWYQTNENSGQWAQKFRYQNPNRIYGSAWNTDPSMFAEWYTGDHPYTSTNTKYFIAY